MGKNACLKYIKNKIRGSTVLEVVVSLTICMIIFSISMRFILKMQTSNNTETKQRAELMLMCAMADLETFGALDPGLYRHGNLSLMIDTVSCQTYPGLCQVSLSVRLSEGKIIRTVSFYIRKTSHETSD